MREITVQLPGPGQNIGLIDDRGAVWRLAGLALFLLVLGLGGIAVLLWAGESYWVAWALALFLALLGGMLILPVARRLRRGEEPFLILEDKGFRCPGLVEPFIPWPDLLRANVASAGLSASTNLFFRPEVALPVPDGRQPLLRFGRRRHVLSIAGPVPRGTEPEVLEALLQVMIEGKPDA